MDSFAAVKLTRLASENPPAALRLMPYYAIDAVQRLEGIDSLDQSSFAATLRTKMYRALTKWEVETITPGVARIFVSIFLAACIEDKRCSGTGAASIAV